MRMEGLVCMGIVCVSVILVVCVCVSSRFSWAILVFFLSQPAGLPVGTTDALQHEVSEILAGVDRRTALPKVVVHTPYSSKETYFDTYFRLLHEDAHHGLRESLACCREGRPCEDGSVVRAVLVGCALAEADRAEGRLNLVFRVDLPPGGHRLASRHWMYRNLVLIIAGDGSVVERATIMRHDSGTANTVWLALQDHGAPGNTCYIFTLLHSYIVQCFIFFVFLCLLSCFTCFSLQNP